MARFPFIKASAEYLRSRGFELSSIVSNIAFDRARSLGKRRVWSALEESEISDPVLQGSLDCDNEIISYAISRILVSVVDLDFLTRRYAMAEAKRAGRLLEKEDEELLLSLAEDMSMPAEKNENGFLLDFPAYLQFATQLKSKEWKLYRRPLENGRVWLSKRDMVRMIEQALVTRFNQELPLPITAELKSAFHDEAKKLEGRAKGLKETFKPKDMGRLSVTRLPPCMRKLLAEAQGGENLPHSARFGLTAFLHAIGMNAENILNLFAVAPDFRADIARYQVEHITGDGSGTEYSPPNCETMKTYSLCPGEDSLCAREWLNSPLYYYKLKGRPRKGARGAGKRPDGKEGPQNKGLLNTGKEKEQPPEDEISTN